MDPRKAAVFLFGVANEKKAKEAFSRAREAGAPIEEARKWPRELAPPPHAAHPPRRLHPALRSRCAPCSRPSLYDCAKIIFAGAPVLTSFASGLIAAYFFFPPKLSFYIADPLNVAELGFFLLLAVIASKAVEVLTQDVRKSSSRWWQN